MFELSDALPEDEDERIEKMEMIQLDDDCWVTLEENGRWYESGSWGGSPIPLTRNDVIDLIGERINELPSNIIEDLHNLSLRAKIEDQFHLLGLSWEEMEKWAANCYRLDQNPLPAIRKSVGDLCKVVFAYDSPGVTCNGNKPLLVCWLSNDGNREEWSVTLTEYGG